MEVFQEQLFRNKPLAYIDSYDKIVPATVKKVEVNEGRKSKTAKNSGQRIITEKAARL